MQHLLKVNTGTYRVDWPFFRMEVGDYVILRGPKAKEMKVRAVAAAYHYREAYGKWFKAEKISDNEFKIIRYK